MPSLQWYHKSYVHYCSQVEWIPAWHWYCSTAVAGPLWVQHSTESELNPQQVQYAFCTLFADSKKPAASSVEGTVVVVGTGAGEGGTGFIPGQSTRMVSCGKAERADTLQFVLQTPAEEGWFFGDFACLRIIVIIIMRQANHGVSLR